LDVAGSFAVNARHLRQLRQMTVIKELKLQESGLRSSRQRSSPNTLTAMDACRKAGDILVTVWNVKFGNAAERTTLLIALIVVNIPVKR
jgi:hypothetical protein